MIAKKIREGYSLDNRSTNKDMFSYIANQIFELQYEGKEEPKFILIDKSTEETMETCDSLKEAIQLLDYNTQYIYDTKNKCKVNHIEY